MCQNMRLIKLTLIGARKNYEIVFRKGLNYISGPTSTGKTSILEMINYALGSKKHKNYIEIGKSCTMVELELFVKNKRIKIQRYLFDFNKKVKIYEWDYKKSDYKLDFHLLEIGSPSNPNSLSYFILDKLNLSKIKIVNDDFSFRDLFKYSYLKQTEIDNENILGEKIWQYDMKRKPTFEIIFKFYDKLLQDLKANLKYKKQERKELEIKLNGIKDFLESVEIIGFTFFIEEKDKLQNEKKEKVAILNEIKEKNIIHDKVTLDLQNKILTTKDELSKLKKAIFEQKDYLNNLMILRNQYNSEIERLEFIIEGHQKLNKIQHLSCPACLQPIKSQTNGCSLCGSEDKQLVVEEIMAFKYELRKLKAKSKKLLIYIEEENNNLNSLEENKEKLLQTLSMYEEELLHLHKGYVNPFIEQIEKLNYEIGGLSKDIMQLEKNYKLVEKLNNFESEYIDKNEVINEINDKIKEIENGVNDKQTIIDDLSGIFRYILEDFKFPKLSDAYIDEKRYLPHVRNRLYSDLGSLGGVTLITMAYYLSILILGISNDNNHLGVLLIDSPRSNLGSSSDDKDELFKDEAIFNSVVKFFIEFDEKYNEKAQIIVINNGYPEFLNSKYIIKEFDGEGAKDLPYGLIDDINIE